MEDPGKSMPRIPRTPQAQAQAQAKESEQEKVTVTPQPAAQDARKPEEAMSIEALLIAMEGRLTGRMDKTNETVKEAVAMTRATNVHLNELEKKVDNNEAALRRL